VAALDTLLRTLSYRNVLGRGFALVRTGGQIVRSVEEISAGAPLDIQLGDGHVSATATSGSGARRTGRKPAPSPGTQGTLL
jgi:exodeoxyribonuclease VII large subunit